MEDALICAEFGPIRASGVAYLNGASRSPMPRCVEETGLRVVSEKTLPWTLGLGDAPALVRDRFARLVGVEGSVAITPSTSFAMSAVANALAGEVAGRSTWVLEGQMSSNVLCWQSLGGLAVVRRPGDNDWTRAVVERVRKGDLVAVPHCHWADGTKLNLTTLSKRCLDAGATLVVDATQSLGVLPLDVDGPLRRLDFLCASTHKWLLGPYGCSPLWVGPHRSDRVFEPLVHDEHNLAGYDDKSVLPFLKEGYPVELPPGGATLAGGGRPNPVLLPMVAEGLRFLLEDLGGPKAIATFAENLAESARSKCAAVPGLDVSPRGAPHFFGVQLRDDEEAQRAEWAVDCAAFLKKERDVHTTGRLANLRVAFHVYNTPADVERLAAGLEDFMKIRQL